MENRYAQAIFARARTSREFFFCKGVSPPNDPPKGVASDAALGNWLARELKDSSTIQGNIEFSDLKPPSTRSSRTQKMHETRKKKRNDYAFGIISSLSLHDVGRHLTDLVVMRLIMPARSLSKAWRTSASADSGMGVVLDKPLKH
jgi:hypothetical protein